MSLNIYINSSSSSLLIGFTLCNGPALIGGIGFYNLSLAYALAPLRAGEEDIPNESLSGLPYITPGPPIYLLV